MKELLVNIFKEYGFCLTQEQCKKFEKYYDFLITENEKYNLTAITDQREVVVKHFLDSVLPVSNFSKNAKLIDVGSGAGFPGIPIKILCPDLDVVLLDSLLKRVNFLNQCIEVLGLKKIIAVHSRAEDYAQVAREKFDYAVSRAVAQVNTLSEYIIPFLKVGGEGLLYKSQKLEDELNAGENAITILGGRVKTILNYNLDGNQRNVVIIEKIKNTPLNYPRGKNLPKTKPLG